MRTWQDNFRTNLRRLRGRTSRFALSELLGLSKNCINKYEKGESVPSVQALITIADHFNVSLDWLIGTSDKV